MPMTGSVTRPVAVAVAGPVTVPVAGGPVVAGCAVAVVVAMSPGNRTLLVQELVAGPREDPVGIQQAAANERPDAARHRPNDLVFEFRPRPVVLAAVRDRRRRGGALDGRRAGGGPM